MIGDVKVGDVFIQIAERRISRLGFWTFSVKIKHEFQSGFVEDWRVEDSSPNREKLTPPLHPPTRLGVCSPSNLEDK
jgi:hypothetical protein